MTDNKDPQAANGSRLLNRIVRLVGELFIESQEGGYAAPSISFRTGEKEWKTMEELLQELIEIPGFDDGDTHKTVEVVVRIIEPNTPVSDKEK